MLSLSEHDVWLEILSFFFAYRQMLWISSEIFMIVGKLCFVWSCEEIEIIVSTSKQRDPKNGFDLFFRTFCFLGHCLEGFIIVIYDPLLFYENSLFSLSLEEQNLPREREALEKQQHKNIYIGVGKRKREKSSRYFVLLIFNIFSKNEKPPQTFRRHATVRARELMVLSPCFFFGWKPSESKSENVIEPKHRGGWEDKTTGRGREQRKKIIIMYAKTWRKAIM